MSSLKILRLESLALRELALFSLNSNLNKDLHNITYNKVKITNDLSFMTIYYTVYHKDDEFNQKYYDDLLDKYNKNIRMYLASRLNARKMPELKFKYDTSLEYANKIEEILKNINK